MSFHVQPSSMTGVVTTYLLGNTVSLGVATTPMLDVMSEIIAKNWNDILKDFFIGGDGKNCIVALRAYPSFHANNQAVDDNMRYFNNPDRYSFGPVGIRIANTTINVNGSTAQGRYVTKCFEWETFEMEVPHVTDQTIPGLPDTAPTNGNFTENYMDYMATYQLYLPFYGYLTLDPSDCVNHKIKVHYTIDLSNGDCTIQVLSKMLNNDVKGHGPAVNDYYVANEVKTTFGVDIPFSPNLTSEKSMASAIGMLRADAMAVKAGVAIGSAVAGMPATTAVTSINDAATSHVVDTAGSENDKTINMNRHTEKTTTTTQNKQPQDFTNPIINALPTHPANESGDRGGCSGGGFTAGMYPYLIVTHPVSAAPLSYGDYFGSACCKEDVLRNCEGYTQISGVNPIRLETDYPNRKVPKYFNEIISMLERGVYFGVSETEPEEDESDGS